MSENPGIWPVGVGERGKLHAAPEHLENHALDPIEECKLNARLQGKHEIPGAWCQQHHVMAVNHWKAKFAHPHGHEIS